MYKENTYNSYQENRFQSYGRAVDIGYTQNKSQDNDLMVIKLIYTMKPCSLQETRVVSSV